MIRQLSVSLYLIIITSLSLAQEPTIDSQKMEAGRKNPDSNFVKYLSERAMAYSKTTVKNDSAEILLTEGIMIAEKIGYINGLSETREALAQFYYQKGKLSPSLSLLLKNDAMAIQVGDSTRQFTNLRLTAMIYIRIGDTNMARNVLNRRQNILDNKGIKGLKDTSYHVLSQYNSLATFYSLPQINKLDSGEYFYRKIYLLGTNTAGANLWTQLSNAGLGKFYTSKKMYDSAFYHYKLSLVAASKVNRFDNYYGFVIALADSYRQSGQLDSAYHYAYKAYREASEFSYIGLMASSSGLLATLYNQQQRYDSAVKYMTFERQYKDSIIGQETLKNIQVLTSEQQLKKLETKREKEEAIKDYKATLRNNFFIGGLLLLLMVIGLLYRIIKQRTQSKKQIETAYNDLKATQSQLIQSEKMASLGELTAGIAHEIQNPLNFVNNFSDVNKELLEELKEEADRGNIDEVKAIASDVISNEEKINHHGKRADAIVKGMLQHSRNSGGVKEPTDINALCDEYLRLSYHGLRAKDKSFNATMKTEFDKSLQKINIIPQDIGRVVLNLINNAFYAVDEKKKKIAPQPSRLGGTGSEGGAVYKPIVTICTKRISSPLGAGGLLISVSDNGNGIPQKVLDKIFQPFFTTKPTGQGTGLGLSLSYDIVKAHGGELKVETKEGEGSTFIISLPTNNN